METWEHFPDKEKIQTIFNQIDFAGTLPLVPYQFVLKIMCGIYKSLSPWENMSADYCEPPPKTAKAAPLRAIAFFSWENESQIFLTRRVFPTYFGFLSYSHVPRGWGALGCALKEISERKESYETYSTIKDIHRESLLVPYLREADRIQYKTVLTLPVFENGKKSCETNLQGAWVFYLNDSDCLPDRMIEARLKTFAETTAITLQKHHKKMYENFPEREGWKEKLQLGTNYSGQLIINALPDSNIGGLESLGEAILKNIINSDFHVITLPMVTEKSVKIVVAGREGITEAKLKARVLSAVGAACNDCGFKGHVSYQFNFALPP